MESGPIFRFILKRMRFLSLLLPGMLVFALAGVNEAQAAAPVFQAAGPVNDSTVDISPAWPIHLVDDIALLFVESTGGEAATLSVAAGFAAVANSPQATGAGTAGTRITVFWARATSTAMGAPTVADPGNHVVAQILTYRGVINTGDPWDITGGGVKAAASTSVTVTGVTTTVVDTLIVAAVAQDIDANSDATWSAWANANLTGITERSDWGGNKGNGGGFGIMDRVKATAGATGNTTATVLSSINAFLTIALKPIPPPITLNHIRLEHDGSGVTCTPSAVTVKACLNVACSELSTSSVTVTLSPASGWAANPITFTGSTTASLAITTPQTVTLGTSAVSPTPSGATQCFVGATANCSLVFADTGFIFSGSAGGTEAIIPIQVAGTSGGTYYLRAVKKSTTTQACEAALAGASTVNFAYECNDPTTCYGANLMSVNGGTATTIARNNNGSVTNYTPVSMTFDANGNAPFTFNYGDVGRVTLHASKAAGGLLLSALAGSSNAYVIKPGGFVLSGIKQTATPQLVNPAAADASGAKFVKAGEAFTVTVTATTTGGQTTPNYGKESTPEGMLLTPNIVLPVAGNNPALSNGTLAGGSFSDGAATVTNLSWGDVGIITLTPSVGDGNYLGAGNVTGTTTGNVGRFYPDHFLLTPGTLINRVLSNCSVAPKTVSSFTYAGEQMQVSFTLTARNALATPTTTSNYASANGFAKLGGTVFANFGFGAVDLADLIPPTGATALTLDPALSSSSGVWTSGAGSFTATTAVTRTTPGGPFESFRLGIVPTDSDGVTLRTADLNLDTTVPADSNERALAGSTAVRFGRLRLQNAHGSELLNLPIPMMVQYWDGTAFVTNTPDSCTTILASDIRFNYLVATPNLVACETAMNPSGSITFSAGVAATTRLTQPGAGNNGAVDLTVNLNGASGNICTAVGGSGPAATNANRPYLQGAWTGTAYDDDPAARATFGVYKGRDEFIYLRESY